ncbi:ADP-ribosylation factor(Arf)/Arf-like (Arl) small GTPase family protein (macronuclear) [Tetrahymena thermophila SB210]|uniref:ADP-ribosylation factor(Arf)/Arf-like (Arl) small GTPase family protein n=1 Tax=Tetrahymena thermophila (strain SB210) TaxID=312017 RepID=Q24C79_TETTS|nr:ADP-ribosylation factor(Arf)/Arf-like (Arl) small GTPase family protein [Tetrahymena thermophila SB210]EAS05359.1 ADP-ribosylation factor(Arf)/Arf-like (Arl) small GTPase family protein [Tetrahymena thermophila SB210]|eukprot:XP_001025604.1 ADP-ribosylation factor(Arf)/Arf-like (Arl) small GTPase family protein [Tetrahymena thermophila SB210]
MGQFIAKAYYSHRNKRERRLLMLGLDGAGKTTVLDLIKLKEQVQIIPTYISNIKSVQYKNLKFIIWDIPDQKKNRQLCDYYSYFNHGLIYVLDSTDSNRMNDVKQALKIIIERMIGIPVLILANKQDIAVMSVSEIQEKLQMHTIKGIGEWHIQRCCSLNGEGIYEGFSWLSKVLNKQQKQNGEITNDGLDSLLDILNNQQKLQKCLAH